VLEGMPSFSMTGVFNGWSGPACNRNGLTKTENSGENRFDGMFTILPLGFFQSHPEGDSVLGDVASCQTPRPRVRRAR
jgi:hypothetical protein